MTAVAVAPANLDRSSEYVDKLRHFSAASVDKCFNAFKDVPWDDPAYAIDPLDERWILPDVDLLARSDWYQSLPRERQIEVGRYRLAAITKTGSQFEQLLLLGGTQFLMNLRNDNPEFRYFMQIHIAEEARHISFAHEFIARKAHKLPRWRRVLLRYLYPLTMRILAGVIATPSRGFCKQYGIPRTVIKDLYYRKPESKKMLKDLFADVRTLAEDSGLMTPGTRAVWRALEIDGRPARYRSEPAPKAA